MNRRSRLLVLLFFALSLSGCFETNKPKVLIIGDSISYGYYPKVKKQLRKLADVHRIDGNGLHTKFGLEKIQEWLGEEDWDMIVFNWGLWDLCYWIHEPDKYGKKDKFNGQQETSIPDYQSNLDSLLVIMKKTNAKLIFITTSYVPPNEPGMFTDDVPVYNKAAIEIMNNHSIKVLDIYQKSKEIHELYGEGPGNVHYTKKGYRLLGKNISDFLSMEIKRTE